jgi:RNA polymerase sigma-70 factor (ECF subfamily)
MSGPDTVQWSAVLRGQAATGEVQATLEALCRAYRAPVLAYIRHRGYRTDAEDLTQAFFTRFIEHGHQVGADATQGRFRAFLLTAVKRFLLNTEEEGRTIKRGGKVRFESFEAGRVRLDNVASDAETPERVFERAWAMTVLEAALGRLREEALAAGKGEVFDQLRDFLLEAPDKADYAELAKALRLRRNTLAVAVHRLRQRLRELIRTELAATAASGGDLECEVDELRAALGPVMHEPPDASPRA